MSVGERRGDLPLGPRASISEGARAGRGVRVRPSAAASTSRVAFSAPAQVCGIDVDVGVVARPLLPLRAGSDRGTGRPVGQCSIAVCATRPIEFSSSPCETERKKEKEKQATKLAPLCSLFHLAPPASTSSSIGRAFQFVISPSSVCQIAQEATSVDASLALGPLWVSRQRFFVIWEMSWSA